MARKQFNHVLTKINIDEIRNALIFYYPQVVGEKGRVDPGKFSTANFLWSGRLDFDEDIIFLTDIDLINVNESQLYQSLKIVDQSLGKLANTNPVEGNRPTTEELASMEEKADKREASQKRAVENAEKSVESAINKQKEIQAALQNKKIYAKVEISKQAPLPDENTNKFIEEAKNHPASFQKDLAASIKTRMSASLSKTLTDEEIEFLATKAAYDTVYAINNFPAQSSSNTEAAILKALAKDSQVLPKIVSDKNATELLKRASSELEYFENKVQLSKLILSSVNENLATSVFGTGPENLKVSLSDQPVEGYTHEVDLGQLNNGYSNLLGSQLKAFDNLSSFTGDNINRALMGQARSFFDSQIANLPADNVISGIYNSEIGQQVLSLVGLGEATPLGESFFGSFIQQIPGASAFFEGLGNTLGIDFGFTAAVPATEMAGSVFVATEGATLVEGAAIAEGGTLLAEGATGIVAAGGLATGVETAVVVTGTSEVAAGAAAGGLASLLTGPLAPIVAAVTAVVGAVIGWVTSKINWAKIKENLIAISGGMLAVGLLVFPNTIFGTILSITGGLGLIGGVANGGLSGLGTSLSGIGSGIAGFFGALGGAFLESVGMPILVTLLVFPVVVALILFIINSGAYIVPPTTSTTSQNPYINIEKVATPSGPFQNTDLPKTITYKVTVTAKTGTLTKVVITDNCKVIKKNGTTDCPTTSIPTPPDSISPPNPYIFDYTSTYDSSNYFDSLITNDINVTAVVDNKQESATGGTSIIIGKPPTSCFTFDNSWAPGDKAQVLAAIAQLSQATTYMATLCGAWGTIPLSYSGEPEPYAGFFTGNGILLYHYAVAFGEHGTLYTLAHESGHAYAARVAGIYSLFASTPGLTEKICTYLPSYHPPSEDFAEMIGLYVAQTPNVNTDCMSNFKTQYANYWQFAHDHIFFQNLGW